MVASNHAKQTGTRRNLFRVEEYKLFSGLTGHYIRKATKVVYKPTGETVKFIERMPQRLAIPQAEKILEKRRKRPERKKRRGKK
jgi:hypothetical protein